MVEKIDAADMQSDSDLALCNTHTEYLTVLRSGCSLMNRVFSSSTLFTIQYSTPRFPRHHHPQALGNTTQTPFDTQDQPVVFKRVRSHTP